MSDVGNVTGRPVQRRDRLYFHPPHPWLTIRLHTGILLVLSQSATTHALERFQINPHGRMAGDAGAYQLARLSAADWDTVGAIRDFYNHSQQGGAFQLRDPQLIAWLQAQVRGGWLAAFWFQGMAELGQAVMNPAEVAPVPAPAAQAVAQWSIRHKIIAMFQAVPSHLSGAARAQFEAFLTPKNLALLAGFFVLVAAVQAAPVADAVVDAILTGLAWAMYGWAGLVAMRDLVKAVIDAARAKSQSDIDHAAQEAAGALVVLGVTLFLKKLADRVQVENSTGPKPAEPEPPPKPAAKPSSLPPVAKPNPFLPKKIGVTEPGAVPWTPELQEQMDAADARGAMSAPGYPDLPANVSQTFSDAVPWDGDNPTNGYSSINRVIGEDGAAGGSYWAEAGEAPDTEAEWRSDFAVKNEWNGDGAYVTSPTAGLKGWIGPAAPQMSSDGSSVLLGNGQQIWIPRNTASPSSPVPTPWNTGGS